jgi:hypothetical protein
MDAHDDDRPAPAEIPGLPCVARSGAGARSGWVYSVALGEAIAREYEECGSGGLWELRQLAPDRIPPAGIVRAWCKQFPAFGLLMRQAEQVRAEKLMEETLVIADNDTASPAKVALRIKVRQDMAAKLDRARFGTASPTDPGAATLGQDKAQPVALGIDDATLAGIAAQALGERAGAGG